MLLPVKKNPGIYPIVLSPPDPSGFSTAMGNNGLVLVGSRLGNFGFEFVVAGLRKIVWLHASNDQHNNNTANNRFMLRDELHPTRVAAATLFDPQRLSGCIPIHCSWFCCVRTFRRSCPDNSCPSGPATTCGNITHGSKNGIRQEASRNRAFQAACFFDNGIRVGGHLVSVSNVDQSSQHSIPNQTGRYFAPTALRGVQIWLRVYGSHLC